MEWLFHRNSYFLFGNSLFLGIVILKEITNSMHTKIANPHKNEKNCYSFPVGIRALFKLPQKPLSLLFVSGLFLKKLIFLKWQTIRLSQTATRLSSNQVSLSISSISHLSPPLCISISHLSVSVIGFFLGNVSPVEGGLDDETKGVKEAV
jgi:hypothetical protein